MRRSILLIALATLSGCSSSLAVRKIGPGDTVVGYPYRLKFTQFEIPITWRVIKCDPVQNGLKFKITAEPKDKAVPDPDYYYAIDPTRLQGPFRNTEFGMEWYEDRSTKAINSSVDDQTGTAIVNTLTAAANLAAGGLLPFGGVGRPMCPKAVTDALAAIDGKTGQEAITKAAQKEVEEQTAVVTALAAKLAALGTSADEGTKQELARASQLLELETANLAAQQAKLKRLLDVLTDTRTLVWPRRGNEFASDPNAPIRPSQEAMSRWNMPPTSNGANVYLALLPIDGAPLPAAEWLAQQAAIPPTGVPYREPRQMKLFVCAPNKCSDDAAAIETSKALVKGTEVWVLQGGTMFYLPFRAQTFAHIKSSAGFAQNGVLTSAGSSQLRGAGIGVTETLKGGSEQLSAIVKNAQAADTARIQAKVDEFKAQKALADAEAALLPNPDADKEAAIKAFQTDATLATAERTKIEAEQALAAAKAQHP
jgi:hypothetical protein